jgi:hypothetical protein
MGVARKGREVAMKRYSVVVNFIARFVCGRIAEAAGPMRISTRPVKYSASPVAKSGMSSEARGESR